MLQVLLVPLLVVSLCNGFFKPVKKKPKAISSLQYARELDTYEISDRLPKLESGNKKEEKDDSKDDNSITFDELSDTGCGVYKRNT